MNHDADSISFWNDTRTISLIGLAHSLSHFFHLLLPPLFPIFISEFGLTYTELGILMSIFFAVSGIGQVISGFLVDKIGARSILFSSICLLALSALCAAMANSYAGLIVSVIIAGCGSAPFHPVDFTILNARVSASRLGHAFSVHGITGSLGWAAAPIFLLSIINFTGSWRIALVSAAALALIILVILFYFRSDLDVATPAILNKQERSEPIITAISRVLKMPVVWFCFIFLFFLTAGLASIQGFAQLGIVELFGEHTVWIAIAITVFMLFNAVGMFIGGFLASGTARPDRLIGIFLLLSAALMMCIGAQIIPSSLVVAALSFAGLSLGIAGPSRDMLIKKCSPPGATGLVYGLVYCGLDIGFSLAPPVFGWMLDNNYPQGVFYGSAVALICAVLSSVIAHRYNERASLRSS
jgi:FSR family fosmidomycin resistance protein-like MFS transporter